LSANFRGANSLSFSSHSLGARMVLETIRNIPSSFKLNAVAMMAAAIDDTCLNGEYKDAAARVGRISVLASSCDEVLKWAFPVANPISGILTRGDPYWHGALGRFGPNPPDQPSSLSRTPILPDSWDFGHHSYINCMGAVVGPSAEASAFLPLPLYVPPKGTQIPTNSLNWQQAWAAGFVSSVFS
jgi:hypothetical protein